MKEYECLMYVEFNTSIKKLSKAITCLFSGCLNNTHISTYALEIDVLSNDDNHFDENFDHVNNIYLTYSFILDIGSNTKTSKEDFVSSVSRLLTFFWNKKCPAVARSEFSELFPYNGEGMQHQRAIFQK
jgi:hypothetical protein